MAACFAGFGAAVGEAAVTEVNAAPPFGHYQPILDRMPFGALPANFGQVAVDPAAAQTAAQVQAEQQKLAKQVNMSAVNITPEGKTAIGFTDLSAKPPLNYYLLVGASADGWNVISADYDEEIATLEKDGVTITLKLGKGLVDPASAPTGAPAKAPALVPSAPAALATAAPQAPAGVPGLMHRPGVGTLARGGEGRPSLVRLPMESAAPMPAPQAAAAGDAAAAGLRSYKERLLERKTQETEAQAAAAKQQQEQLVKLAREAAMKEIARREAEAAEAAAEAGGAEQPMDVQQQEAPQQEGTVP